MTLVQVKTLGFGRDRILGTGGTLDTLRFSYFISKELGISPRKVDSIVIGEHGDSMIPVASRVMVDGKPLGGMIDSVKMDGIKEKTRNGGAEVISLKGSTFYAPSVAIMLVADSIVNDRKKVLPASAYLDGEYGVSGICMGVPVRLGSSGIDEIVELDLSGDEKDSFMKSGEVIRSNAKDLGLLD
jgi:malate dehydrogenase